MKKFLLPSFIIGIMLVFLLSFIEIEKISSSKDSEVILYAVNSVPNELKDVSKLSTREEDVICATSKGLVEKNDDGKIVPSLATEINIKDNGIEYEFKIREDAYWSDGSRITAEDIREFFKELLKEESDENIKSFLNVYGAKEFRKGNVTFESGVAIGVNDNILTIRLNNKDEKFLEELTKPQYRLRKYLMMWNNIERNHKNIIYSGEYYISDVNDKEVFLEKNKKSDTDSPSSIKIISDESEELSMAAFEIGDRDLVVEPPNTELNRLEEEGRLKTFPSDSGKYIVLNSEDEELPLSVRKVIYYTLNSVMLDYKEENNNYLELTECSYFRGDKENLNKLQSRKVMTNKVSAKLPEVITILAKDNNENRALCKYIESWFDSNTDSNIRYTLTTEEDFNNLELRKRYDILIVDLVANTNNRLEFYKNLKPYYTDKEEIIYKKELSGKGEFIELESNLFNNYRILPLLFENKNVAISSEVENIEFDWNGNIKFETLK